MSVDSGTDRDRAGVVLTIPDRKPAVSERMKAVSEKTHSPAAKARRAQTRRQNAELLKEDILFLYEDGLVPAAIAKTVGRSMPTVAGYLRELEAEGWITVPAYLSLANRPPSKQEWGAGAAPHKAS